MRARRCLLLLALGPVLLLVGRAGAEGPSPAALVDTLQYDPESPTALTVLDRLAEEGERGFKALAALAIEFEGDPGDLAQRAAYLLAAGDESARRTQAGRCFDQVEDADLRQTLALGLARAYPEGAERLHAHLRREGPGALDLLRILALRGLPREEVEAAARHAALESLAKSLLEGRGSTAEEVDLLPRARKTALLGLDPRTSRAFLEDFEKAPSISLLGALAEVLREDDPDARAGAHCLLLHVSGLELAPDPELWHSWIDGREGTYTPPDPVSKGAIRAAIERGLRHLKEDLLADGVCYHRTRHASSSGMGATALAVLAMRASGVPPEAPAVRKAIETTMLVFDRGGRPGLKAFPNRWETYSLALLAMTLRRFDSQRMRDALVAIRDRLANGVLENGQWTYQCISGTAGSRPQSGDNSNTQYANLGLRALRAGGIDIPAALWDRVDAHWRRTQHEDGVWGYRVSGADHRRGPVQMTASGIAGLAIAHEGRDGARAAAEIGADESILKGLRWMGQSLLLTDFHLLTPYTLYAVERACVLTGTRAFAGGGKTIDWYREGAWRLLRTQNADGSWGKTSIRSWERDGFGLVPSTAFALLFLTKATATVGDGVGEKIVAVSVTPEQVATPPPNRAPATAARTALPWQLPESPTPELVGLHVERSRISTSTDKALIRGRLTGPWSRLEIAGAAAEVDEDGLFEALVERAAPGWVELVAYGPEGQRASRSVHVTLDGTPPTITLEGPALRHVGKQRLKLEANEDLDGVKVGRYFFPAAGRTVWVTAELGEHTRTLAAVARDRAGNRTRQTFPLEIVNRAAVLDGKSAFRHVVREKPDYFTLECWAKTQGVPGHRAIVSDTEGGGMGIFVTSEEGGTPEILLRRGDDWLIVRAKRPLKKNRWHHLAMTYDGHVARLWVNGKLAAEGEAAKYRKSGKALLIGAEPNRHNRPAKPFPGLIDEVRLSSIVRYTKRFQPAYSHMADRHTVLLVHFDTDTEAGVLDTSGEQHNGVPLGQPKISAEKR